MPPLAGEKQKQAQTGPRVSETKVMSMKLAFDEHHTGRDEKKWELLAPQNE